MEAREEAWFTLGERLPWDTLSAWDWEGKDDLIPYAAMTADPNAPAADAPTAPPPLPPLPPQEPRWRGLLAWLVILGCVAYIMNQAPRRGRSGETGEGPNMQLRLLSQTAIGIRNVVTEAGGAQRAELLRISGQVVTQLRNSAQTPMELLDLAIVLGELQGKEQALAQLRTTTLSADLQQDADILNALYERGPATLEPAQRERLTRRHGFFGRVALSYGLESSSEPRKSMLDSTAKTFAVITVFGIGLFVVLLASAGLLLTAAIFYFQGKLRPAYIPDPLANTAYLEAFALYLVLYLASGRLLGLLGVESLAWNLLALFLIPIILLWTKWRGATPEARRQAFGWPSVRRVPREMLLGLVGYLAGLPLIALAGVLISKSGGRPAPHPIVSMLEGSLWHVVILYVLACVMAPALEETMFRGAFYHHLRRRWGWLISASVVGLIFAALHPQGWMAIPLLGAVGFVLATIREWRGSIAASMTAHAANNFIILTLSRLLLG